MSAAIMDVKVSLGEEAANLTYGCVQNTLSAYKLVGRPIVIIVEIVVIIT